MALYMIKTTDGGVLIMDAAEGVTPEDEIQKWHPDERVKFVSCHQIDASAIPADRYFRDAWTHRPDNAGIATDMVKARDLHNDKLRRRRAPLLAAADIEYQRADEVGDTAKKKEIATRKQLLRDATADPRIAAAQTPEELKAIVPDVLIS